MSSKVISLQLRCTCLSGNRKITFEDIFHPGKSRGATHFQSSIFGLFFATNYRFPSFPMLSFGTKKVSHIRKELTVEIFSFVSLLFRGASMDRRVTWGAGKYERFYVKFARFMQFF